MPFVSKKQEKFGYANPEKFGGAAGLAEWSAATDQSSLPDAAPRKKKKNFSYAPRVKTGFTKEQKAA